MNKEFLDAFADLKKEKNLSQEEIIGAIKDSIENAYKKNYGASNVRVEVDMETGYVDVTNVTASHDVGTVVNPQLAKGQIYGGILMGQGYCVMEDVAPSNGVVRNKNFDNYIIPTAMDAPQMTVNLFECDDPHGTYGAKSLGEPATEAVGGAIANAIYHAPGRRIRENPCDLESVLLGHKLSK